MPYLIGVTLLWAFSFSLIGVYLAGQVDAYFAVMLRVLLAALIFLPFLRWRTLSKPLIYPLMGIGAIQLGIMYICFYHSFLYLSVAEVLLFTIFTPLYITLIYDGLKGRFTPWYLVTAAIAVLGALVIRYQNISEGFLIGFLLVQAANLCFAIGQVAYKYLLEKQNNPIQQASIFGFFYLGALCIAVPAFLIWGNLDKLPSTSTHWGILLWLGVVASGIGYFLWNKGACLVDAGALAIMNNALVPAGLLVNVLIWNKEADLTRLSLGGALILGSLIINEYWVKPRVELHRGHLEARH
ncbi:carboxylate/amino acid/amine transporter [Allopseudospirillum japonicum]|uniref:Carboxylate/amino acid/amine transporter n=1 Tax=Allopseudospirillum japonicum TaxID=64971 RepID=A0A1H6SQY3_9GAMM|nr:carboxylate/amino acid/amine transporter [Allopseudospirillum japonicum]SEI70211.1 carboxylate/amino acid/amine transporter [Allopseudospirillum japonicum]